MEILYQDDALLVINKPAGLSTLPDGYNPSLPHIKSALEEQFGALWIVHRLDKETSGVLLLALSAKAHCSLNMQFEKHQVSKVYHVLVNGNPKWQDITVNLPLRSNGDRHHRTVIDQQAGKDAITHFRVLERFAHHTFLEAIPETGRTHQIRAHLSALNLSIVGDKLYGGMINPQDGEGMHRLQSNDGLLINLTGSMGLHARSLAIFHPVSGEKMIFTAPYPPILLAALQQLRSLDFMGKFD